MKTITRRAARAALCAAVALPCFATSPVQAQDIAGAVPQTPLSDTNCNWDAIPQQTTVPPCTVIGSRSMTRIGTARTSFNTTLDRFETTYHVAFDGTLQIDGVPAVLAQPFTFPVGTRDATLLFADGQEPLVELQAEYDGRSTVFIGKASPDPVIPEDRGFFTGFSNMSIDARSITVQKSGTVSTIDGGEYGFAFRTPDPTAIIGGNSTALTGKFYDKTIDGALQFGSIGGAAVIASGPQITRYPQLGNGGTNTGVLSPFALQYQVTAQLTTQLDGNGLVTPRIAVTDGVEMSGSKVTGLADGSAPTDAVTKAQLDAEASLRAAADTAIQSSIDAEAGLRASEDAAIRADLASEVAIRAAADLQIDQRIAVEEANRQALGSALLNETSSRLAADLALSNQVGALGSRVDLLENRVDILDDRLTSATAMAVAMSGSVFLPGMRFNLTANVGTYDGAHAGSVQFAALITDNVALNAGIATGFNRGGSTAVRAGLTFAF